MGVTSCLWWIGPVRLTVRDLWEHRDHGAIDIPGGSRHNAMVLLRPNPGERGWGRMTPTTDRCGSANLRGSGAALRGRARDARLVPHLALVVLMWFCSVGLVVPTAFGQIDSTTVNWSFLSVTGQLLDEAGNPLSAGDSTTRGDGTLLELLAWTAPGDYAADAPFIVSGPDDGETDNGSYERLAAATVGDGMETFDPELADGRFSMSSNVALTDHLVGAPLIVRVWNAALTAYAELFNPAWHVPAALIATSLDLGQAGTRPLHAGGAIGDGYLTAIATDGGEPSCRVVRVPDRRCGTGQIVAVPVEISDARDIVSFVIDFRYPADLGVEAKAVSCGSLLIAAGWGPPVVCTDEVGRMVISAAGPDALSGSGDLVKLDLLSSAAVSPIPLRLASVALNEGAVCAVSRDGSLILTNKPPVLDAIGGLCVDEKRDLTFTATAGDPDVPPDHLLFSLDGRKPQGARIDPVTGVFYWRPTEAHGPGEYVFSIVVRDDGGPPLSDDQEIRVTVADVNEPPILNVPAWTEGDGGTEFSFTAWASDSDEPRNCLTFSLDGREPGGAMIDPLTGVFRWAPSEADIGEYTFGVLVTDDGSPPLSDLQEVTVSVRAPGEVQITIEPPPVIWCPGEGMPPLCILPVFGAWGGFEWVSLRQGAILASQAQAVQGMTVPCGDGASYSASAMAPSSPEAPAMHVIVDAGETVTFSSPVVPFAVTTGTVTRVENGRVVDVAQTWTPGEYGPGEDGFFTHYLDIEGGDSEGRFWAIADNTADTLTLDAGSEDDLAFSGLGGAPYSIRPFRTVADLFAGVAGASSPSGTAEASEAIVVLAWNGSGFERLSLEMGAGRAEWHAGSGESANAWPVYPDEGLMVMNAGNSAVEILIAGELDGGRKTTVVREGMMLVGTASVEDVSLDESGLLEADGGPLRGGESPAMADQVLIWNGDGYDTYYFSTFEGENVWREAGGEPAGDVMLHAGRGFFLNNRLGEAATWTRGGAEAP